MKKLLILLAFVSTILTLATTGYAAPEQPNLYKSIFKIKTYTLDTISGNYTFSHYGSAVFIDKNRIITNAHVILDADGSMPTGYYEVCRSEDVKKAPVCFTTAKLISYDTSTDLALLELSSRVTNTQPLVISSTKNLSMGTNVVVYGYPAIGGSSITRTEGKIGGNDNLKYKFDGTIDHGNSGGGAFDANGKLIGIPYSVKSDNGMIGYIIPISQVLEFLSGKSTNLVSFSEKKKGDFSGYISKNQVLYKNPNLLKNKYVEIKNALKNDFTLVNTTSNINGNVFLYQFLDRNNRVVINVGCTNDAATSWTSFIDYQAATSNLPDDIDHNTKIATGYIDAGKNIFMTEMTSLKEVKGEISGIFILTYRNAPRCGAALLAADMKNKDKNTYQKGIAFLKTIKFSDVTPILPSFSSPFFSLNVIPKNVFVSEGSSIVVGGNIRPTIGVAFPRYHTLSDFALLDFEDLDGYMNYEYSDASQYAANDYSFSAFFQRYKTTGYTNVQDMEIITKDGKKMIMTIKNYNNLMESPPKYEQEVTFFYPFVTNAGKYKAYKFTFNLHSRDGMDEYTIRDIMISLILPGSSPFKN